VRTEAAVRCGRSPNMNSCVHVDEIPHGRMSADFGEHHAAEGVSGKHDGTSAFVEQ
jgi:hypothetical protein